MMFSTPHPHLKLLALMAICQDRLGTNITEGETGRYTFTPQRCVSFFCRWICGEHFQVRKRSSFAVPFQTKNHHCTKTGSGQTQGKHSRRDMRRALPDNPSWEDERALFDRMCEQVRERHFSRHLYIKMHYFTKTGSGRRKLEETFQYIVLHTPKETSKTN